MVAEQVPLRWLVREVDERANEVAERWPLLSVSVYRGVERRDLSNDGQAASEDVSHYKRVRVGEIAINKLRAFQGGIGLSGEDGLISPAYGVLRLGPRLHGRYVHHLMRSQWFVGELTRRLRGLGAPDARNVRTPHVNVRDVLDIPVPVPPLETQRRIADYLDTEAARIDTLITKNTHAATLVEERLRASAERRLAAAATGVDAGALRYVVRRVVQGWSPQCDSRSVDGITAWGVLKAGASNGGVFRPDENKALPDDLEPRPDVVVQRGDVVVSRANTRDLVGSASVVLDDYPRLMLCDKLYALRLDALKAVPQYVAAVLGTSHLRHLIELDASGSSPSMQNISREQILQLPIALPTVDVQRQVLSEIREERERGQQLLKYLRSQHELLVERRQALITAAVTGEIEI